MVTGEKCEQTNNRKLWLISPLCGVCTAAELNSGTELENGQTCEKCQQTTIKKLNFVLQMQLFSLLGVDHVAAGINLCN
jgi:hypothetical protein